jgi:phosphatidylserine/phosphatidylglycerophosphate/cardiolipin synthase-like enzyme
MLVACVARAESNSIRAVVNRDYLPAALEMINGAEKRIDFLHLEFHYDPTVMQIQQALGDAVARGVKVRGLLEDGIDFNQKSLPFLKELGIDARADTKRKMLHSKMFVVDGKRVLLGSTNLSGNSMDNNNESNVLVDDPRVAEFFMAYIDLLFEDSFREPEIEPVETETYRTVVNREHFECLKGMIDGAERRVDVLMYGIKRYEKYPDSLTNKLLDALVRAAERGVNVRVMMDRSDYNDTLNSINQETADWLKARGVQVRFDDPAVTTHAKVVLADDTVLIGSANWGYDALERRNETSLQISAPSVVNAYADYFDGLWGASDSQ